MEEAHNRELKEARDRLLQKDTEMQQLKDNLKQQSDMMKSMQEKISALLNE
jgi:FtsZ-binding cell division protein ZapB